MQAGVKRQCTWSVPCIVNTKKLDRGDELVVLTKKARK